MIKKFLLDCYSFVLSWLGINKAVQEGGITLDAVRDFYESYIGVVITGFHTYGEDIKDLEAKIQTKIITETKIEKNNLYLKLLTINGKHGGYIKISPEVNGLFAEKTGDADPSWATRYRIDFYGGDCVEYIDTDSAGTITHHEGFLR